MLAGRNPVSSANPDPRGRGKKHSIDVPNRRAASGPRGHRRGATSNDHAPHFPRGGEERLYGP
eukprot:14202628-Alexandrium_andersonii.AAC.1